MDMPKVRDVMSHRVVTLEGEATILAAAELMNREGVGCLVIMGGKGPVGIITERDLVTKILAKGLDPSMCRVADFMSKGLVVCKPDDSLDEAAKRMLSHRIRRLPVVEGGRLVGLLTSRDLVKPLVGRMSGFEPLLDAISAYHKEGY